MINKNHIFEVVRLCTSRFVAVSCSTAGGKGCDVDIGYKF